MGTLLTDEELAAIRARYVAAERAWQLLPAPPSVVLAAADVPRLLAEIDRLRTERRGPGAQVAEARIPDPTSPTPTAYPPSGAQA